jgi:hypothetical protein
MQAKVIDGKVIEKERIDIILVVYSLINNEYFGR